MVDWNKMKSDISRGLKEGLDKVMEGAETVAKKTGEVSAEGQKKVRIFNLKRKIQGYMEDLGVAIYNAEVKTPGSVTDETAKEVIEKIKAANDQLKDLESQ
jgi:hypothetical protein